MAKGRSTVGDQKGTSLQRPLWPVSVLVTARAGGSLPRSWVVGRRMISQRSARVQRLSCMLHDLRYALRTLRANPVFAAMAMLSLALGIGANTAIYSFMDAILVRT